MFARCFVSLRSFRCLLGDSLELSASPSSRCGYVGNGPSGGGCQHRRDHGFGVLTFSDTHEIAIPRREIEVDELGTRALDELFDRGFSILWRSYQSFGVIV